MCRIAGFMELRRGGDINYDAAATLAAMRDTMAYGGPDDAGAYISRRGGSLVALGHRRLSIIELSSLGHQPMKFKNYTIVYNGEIYNFASVKAELASRGREFISNSDTEVILQAYDEWGLSCVDKFRGMWAFAIYDEYNEKLILCRDRVGVKPLYWYLKDGLFIFASELKAFCAHPRFDKKLNEGALGLYLQYGYIPAPRCIFDNTNKVEPASFLIIDKTGVVSKSVYWRASDGFEKAAAESAGGEIRDEDEAAEELEEILTDSFNLRMVSDVPVGMFLSGGIDSTLLLAILSKKCGRALKTFTMGFNEKGYDEAPYAKKTAGYFGSDHAEIYCAPQDAFNAVAMLPQIYDEPFGDASAVPTYLISKFAARSVKVSLSADGGDEQFAGYDLYYILENKVNKLYDSVLAPAARGALDMLTPDMAFMVFDKLRGFFPGVNNFRDKLVKLSQTLKIKEPLARFDFASKYFLDGDIEKLGVKKTAGRFSMRGGASFVCADNLSRMMLLDITTYLPDDVLVKVDRAAMSVALEGRDPFLDHKIIEFSSRLSPALKYKNGVRKYLLKKILYKYAPRELVDRPKKGFAAPVYEWFKNDLKELYAAHLSSEKIRREGIFEPAAAGALLKDFFEDRGVNPYKLWFLFVFELWYEKYMA